MGKEKNINKPTTEKVVDKQEIVDKEITPEDRKKLAQEKIDNIEEKVKQFKEEFKDDPEALQEVHNLFKKSIKDIKELEGGEKDEEDKDDKEKVKSVEEVDLGYLDIEPRVIFEKFNEADLETLKELMEKGDKEGIKELYKSTIIIHFTSTKIDPHNP